MAVIQMDQNFITQINVFTVEPAHQQPLIDRLPGGCGVRESNSGLGVCQHSSQSGWNAGRELCAIEGHGERATDRRRLA